MNNATHEHSILHKELDNIQRQHGENNEQKSVEIGYQRAGSLCAILY